MVPARTNDLFSGANHIELDEIISGEKRRKGTIGDNHDTHYEFKDHFGYRSSSIDKRYFQINTSI